MNSPWRRVAAATTWIVRGDESRRRRGRDVDSPLRQAARLRYDGLPKSVTGGFAAMHAAEGLVLLVDAAFRPRPVKAAAAKKKR